MTSKHHVSCGERVEILDIIFQVSCGKKNTEVHMQGLITVDSDHQSDKNSIFHTLFHKRAYIYPHHCNYSTALHLPPRNIEDREYCSLHYVMCL
jgi:hypothetical protein